MNLGVLQAHHDAGKRAKYIYLALNCDDLESVLLLFYHHREINATAEVVFITVRTGQQKLQRFHVRRLSLSLQLLCETRIRKQGHSLILLPEAEK